jgi:L-fuconolactonase
VDAHPDQVFVLDHIAKPRIKAGVFEPWNKNLRELAQAAECLLQGVWPGDGGGFRDMDGAAGAALFRCRAGGVRTAATDVWLGLAGVSGGVRLCALAQTGFRVGSANFPRQSRARILGGTAVEAYKL